MYFKIIKFPEKVYKSYITDILNFANSQMIKIHFHKSMKTSCLEM